MQGGSSGYDATTGRYSFGPPSGVAFGGSGGGAATSPYAGAFNGLTFGQPAATAAGGFTAGSASFAPAAGAAAAGGTGAAAGGGMGSALMGQALGGLAGNAGGIIGAILGPIVSGERKLNKTKTAILEAMLKSYNATLPMRTSLQTSFLGRLPAYMQANFPSGMTPNRRGGVDPNAPHLPNYPNYPTGV